MPSSVIRDYSYDASRRVLTITFVSGAIYDYSEVPPEVHLGLQLAASRGRYFSTNIRDRYRHIRRWRRGGPGPPPDTPGPPEPQPALPRSPSSPNPPLLAYAEKPPERGRARTFGRAPPRRTPPVRP